MVAAQAALVISNARRYREERRARTDLETLINTSPVGVVASDSQTGVPVSVNREARRILKGLLDPDQPLEGLVEVLKVRRVDGREISLGKFAPAEVSSAGGMVRAERSSSRSPTAGGSL